jgi:alginate O-acetyltransferase complex protein AlgJ
MTGVGRLGRSRRLGLAGLAAREAAVEPGGGAGDMPPVRGREGSRRPPAARPRRLATWARRAGRAAAAAIVAAACGGGADEAAERFRRWCADRAAEAERAGTAVVAGEDGWLFFAPELRFVGAGRFWGERAAAVSRAPADAADPLPAILHVHRELQALGVQLLLVPVPPKAIVHADALGAGVAERPPPRLDVELQRFYATLGEAGVDVLDLTDGFLGARGEAGEAPFCRRDTHWSGTGVVRAAQAIARKIRAAGFDVPPARSFDAEWREVTIVGDLQRLSGRRDLPPERVRVRPVGLRSPEGLSAVDPDAASPVLVVGDSHTLVFHAGGDLHATRAGLPDQLARELGLAVDLAGVRGAGSTAAWLDVARRARRDAGYLPGKRVVIWCFAAREFTEGDGWRRVPLRPDR